MHVLLGTPMGTRGSKFVSEEKEKSQFGFSKTAGETAHVVFFFSELIETLKKWNLINIFLKKI